MSNPVPEKMRFARNRVTASEKKDINQSVRKTSINIGSLFIPQRKMIDVTEDFQCYCKEVSRTERNFNCQKLNIFFEDLEII